MKQPIARYMTKLKKINKQRERGRCRGVEIEGGKELGQAGISFTPRSQTWRALSLSLISSVCLFTSLAPSLPPSLSDFSPPSVSAQREGESKRKEQEEEIKDKQ